MIVELAVQVSDSLGSSLVSLLPMVVTAGQFTVALSSVTVTGALREMLPELLTW